MDARRDATIGHADQGSVEQQRKSSKKKKPPRLPSQPETIKKKKRHHRRKQKLLRPNSPAAYPSLSPLPWLYDDGSLDDSIHKTPPTKHGGGCAPQHEDDVATVTTADISTDISNVTGSDEEDSQACGATNGTESFLAFRIQYLIVHIAIMLADGLQGTHLYVLYEGYGYTVASLYCLGFVSGAVTSPFIGPLVDHKLGRRNSAIIYCVLEIIINMMEQYSVLTGLILSRIVGGITTNLLFTVFESWLVTEHRKRGFSEEKLEVLMRDSVVSSNLSAIASGCLAHVLASHLGPCGPFEGAVGCTIVALILVMTRWEENYGSHHVGDDEEVVPGMNTIRGYMSEAFSIIISDSKIYRIGLIQGLTEGALQTFVFLWSPALRYFAHRLPTEMNPSTIWGLDSDGEPAYGLIFGAFMACGAFGGLVEPTARKALASVMGEDAIKDLLSQPPECLVDGSLLERSASDGHPPFKTGCSSPSLSSEQRNSKKIIGDEWASDAMDLTFDSDSDDGLNDCVKPAAVEFLASLCFIACAFLLAIPVLISPESPFAFSASLVAFLLYELLVGLYMPCEGVLRTVYMPNESICSLMTMLRVIVNVAVALGVISTNYIPFAAAFAACSGALLVAAALQLSLVDAAEWIRLVRFLLSFIPFCSAWTSDQKTSPENGKHPLFVLDSRQLSSKSLVPDVKRLDSTVSISPTLSMSSAVSSVEMTEEEAVAHDEGNTSAVATQYKNGNEQLAGIRRRHVAKVAREE